MSEDLIWDTHGKIVKTGFNSQTSPWEQKVVMFVLNAQGVIDNGGFEYFFESPFEGNPSLDEFAKAFKEIGSSECAATMEKALTIFRSGSLEFGDLEDVFFNESKANYLKLESYIGKRKIA